MRSRAEIEALRREIDAITATLADLGSADDQEYAAPLNDASDLLSWILEDPARASSVDLDSLFDLAGLRDRADELRAEHPSYEPPTEGTKSR